MYSRARPPVGSGAGSGGSPAAFGVYGSGGAGPRPAVSRSRPSSAQRQPQTRQDPHSSMHPSTYSQHAPAPSNTTTVDTGRSQGPRSRSHSSNYPTTSPHHGNTVAQPPSLESSASHVRRPGSVDGRYVNSILRSSPAHQQTTPVRGPANNDYPLPPHASMQPRGSSTFQTAAGLNVSQTLRHNESPLRTQRPAMLNGNLHGSEAMGGALQDIGKSPVADSNVNAVNTLISELIEISQSIAMHLQQQQQQQIQMQKLQEAGTGDSAAKLASSTVANTKQAVLRAQEIERIVRRVEAHFSTRINDLTQANNTIREHQRVVEAENERLRRQLASSLSQRANSSNGSPVNAGGEDDSGNGSPSGSSVRDGLRAEANALDTLEKLWGLGSDTSPLAPKSQRGEANGNDAHEKSGDELLTEEERREREVQQLRQVLLAEKRQRLFVEEQTQSLTEQHSKVVNTLEKRLKKQEMQLRELLGALDEQSQQQQQNTSHYGPKSSMGVGTLRSSPRRDLTGRGARDAAENRSKDDDGDAVHSSEGAARRSTPQRLLRQHLNQHYETQQTLQEYKERMQRQEELLNRYKSQLLEPLDRKGVSGGVNGVSADRGFSGNARPVREDLDDDNDSEVRTIDSGREAPGVSAAVRPQQVSDPPSTRNSAAAGKRQPSTFAGRRVVTFADEVHSDTERSGSAGLVDGEGPTSMKGGWVSPSAGGNAGANSSAAGMHAGRFASSKPSGDMVDQSSWKAVQEVDEISSFLSNIAKELESIDTTETKRQEKILQKW